jgi:type IX secretion system PorP/SprF family membrane protein
MKKISLILTVVIFAVFQTKAQDPTFSQTTAGNVHLNTALAGSTTKARFSTIYRNQWAELSGNYSTAMVNFYQYIPKTNGYGGIKFVSDVQANIFFQKSLSLFYSKNFKLKDLLIRPSLEVGYVNRHLDVSKLTFGDMINPQTGFSNQTGETLQADVNYADVNIGAVFYYKKMLVGLSAHHINQPVSSFTGSGFRLPVNYGTQLSYVFEFNKISISPFAYYNYQNGFEMFVPGVRFMYNDHFNVALSTRSGDALLFNLGYQHKWFLINYSYDVTISKLNNSMTGGSHELSVGLNFWNVKQNEKFMEVKSVF